VALSVGVPCGTASRVYPTPSGLNRHVRLRGIVPFGVRTFLPQLALEAILRPSKIAGIYTEPKRPGKPGTYGAERPKRARVGRLHRGFLYHA